MLSSFSYIITYMHIPEVPYCFFLTSCPERPLIGICIQGNTPYVVQILNFLTPILQWTEVTHDSSDKKNKQYIGPRWTVDPLAQWFWAIRMWKWEIKHGQTSRMKSNDVSVSSLNANVKLPQNFVQRPSCICDVETITFVQHLPTLQAFV